jgi:hypothetical protein
MEPWTTPLRSQVQEFIPDRKTLESVTKIRFYQRVRDSVELENGGEFLTKKTVGNTVKGLRKVNDVHSFCYPD